MSSSNNESLKGLLYDVGLTFSDIAKEIEAAPRVVSYAVKKWEGATGNPKGKTRAALKAIERAIGRKVYHEK